MLNNIKRESLLTTITEDLVYAHQHLPVQDCSSHSYYGCLTLYGRYKDTEADHPSARG